MNSYYPNTLIKLLLIAAIVPLLYGCEALSAIDEGLYQAADAVTEEDRVTGKRVVNLDNRQQQIEQGNKYVEEFLKQASAEGLTYNEAFDPDAYQRIVRIFQRLHSVSHLRHEEWQPILLEEDQWNAITTGGTYFVIYSGLERDLTNDDELAAVIAHEMAHTVAGHIGERSAHMTLSKATGSKSADRETFKQAFTHINEEEADKIGILYCALAGYDPYASHRIWQRKYEETGTIGFIFQDHPMNAERAILAKNVADKVSDYYQAGVQNAEFEQLLESNALWTKQNKTAIEPGKGGGLFTALSAALQASSAKYKAQAEEARQQSRIIFIENVAMDSKLVFSRPISDDTWRIGIQYEGFTPLSEVAWRGVFVASNGEPLEILGIHQGDVRYGQTYYIDFSSDRLYARYQRSDAIRILIDNAVEQ